MAADPGRGGTCQSLSGAGINPLIRYALVCHLMRGQMVADPPEQPGRTARYGYPLFHTHARPQLYSGWPAYSFNSSTDPCTGVTLAYPGAGVIGASSHACPGGRCERGGLMTRGLGRIPAISGTLTQARDEPGNDMPAGRDRPAPGPAGHPADGTSGQGTRTGCAPGHRSQGLAPGTLGWPWHPRRLATARHRGHRVE